MADDPVSRPGFRTSEFFVLAILSTVVVLCAPLVGYQLDEDNLKMLLYMFSGFGALRGGQKIVTVATKPKPNGGNA